MPEATDKLLPKVFAAISAVDEAVAEHELLVERLAAAMQEGARLDEELRAVDFTDHEKMVVKTKAMAFAVSTVQRLAWREEMARGERERAQQVLAEARKVQSRARSELLRIELEIDAASIWDLIGQFEATVRGRLEEHAKIAAAMDLAAAAAGAQNPAALEAATLVPALGASGPDLWNALAGGVKQLYDRSGAPLPGSVTQTPSRADFLRPALLVESIATPPRQNAPVAQSVATPPRQNAPVMRRTVPPPPPPDEDESRFDFARPPAARSGPLPKAFVPRAAPLSRVVSSGTSPENDGASPAAASTRGRLDRMLRNLAGMMGPRRAPPRLRRSQEN
jgi:hypothetical protein